MSTHERQAELFGWPPHSGTVTSADAAEAKVPTAATDRARVLEHIRGCGARGATDEEAQQALGMTGDSYRPRRWELAKAGSIRTAMKGGQAVTRTTRRGRQADVWVAGDGGGAGGPGDAEG